MYENISYAELKSLSKEQKADAWKELKGLYPTQKELAEKLGVNPNLVYNMISRYVKEEASGMEKSARPDAADEPEKIGRRMQRKSGSDEIRADALAPVHLNKTGRETESFSINIKKTATGEDAQFLLNGAGNTLLKNQKYLISVRITEVFGE